MSLSEIVVEGTLNADGTLQLDEKPNLSPGRVTVVLRQQNAPAVPGEDWWQFMQNARKQMEEAGCRFLDEKEMTAHVEWLREGDRIDELLQATEDRRAKPEQR
jgi:hypothetical protein